MKLIHLLWTSPNPKRGIQYQRNSLHITESQWVISDLPHLLEIRIINIKQAI